VGQGRFQSKNCGGSGSAAPQGDQARQALSNLHLIQRGGTTLSKKKAVNAPRGRERRVQTKQIRHAEKKKRNGGARTANPSLSYKKSRGKGARPKADRGETLGLRRGPNRHSDYGVAPRQRKGDNGEYDAAEESAPSEKGVVKERQKNRL